MTSASSSQKRKTRIFPILKRALVGFAVLCTCSAVYFAFCPLSLNFLKPTFLRHMPVPCQIDDLSLTWRRWGGPFVLQIKNLKAQVRFSEGELDVVLPETYVYLDWLKLLKGQLGLKRLTVVKPQWTSSGGRTISGDLLGTVGLILKEVFQTPLLPGKLELIGPAFWPEGSLSVRRKKNKLYMTIQDGKEFVGQGVLTYLTQKIQGTLDWKGGILPSWGFAGVYAKDIPPFSGRVVGTLNLKKQTHGGSFQVTDGQSSKGLGALRLEGSWKNNAIFLTQGSIKKQGTTVTLKGSLKPDPQQISSSLIDLSAQTDSIPLEKLPYFWPSPLSPVARTWVLENLRDGQVTRAALDLNMRWDLKGLFEIERLTGALDLEGLTVDYLEGMPPVRGVAGRALFNAQGFDIQLTQGVLESQHLTGGEIWIRGLDLPDQTFKTQLRLKGPIPNLLAILDNPPLGYTKRLGVPLESLKGDVDTTLDISFPLENDLRLQQIKLLAQGRLTGVQYDFFLKSQKKPLHFTQGVFDLRVTPEGMNLKGTALLDKNKVHLKWVDVFAQKQSGLLTLETLLTSRLFATWGVDIRSIIRDPFSCRLIYKPDLQDSLALEADLTPVSLDLPALTFVKKPGEKLIAKAQLKGFNSQQPGNKTIEDLSLVGRNLAILGGVVLSPDSALKKIDLRQIKSQQQDYALLFDRDKNTLALRGKKADLSGVIEGESGGVSGLLGSGEKIRLIVNLDELRLSDFPIYQVRGIIGGLSPDFEVSQIILRGQYTPPNSQVSGGKNGSFFLTLETDPRGFKTLNLESENGGYLFKALGLMRNIRGGHLLVDATQKATGEAFEGRLRMKNFIVINTPLLTQLFMTLTSPTSFLDLFSGGEIEFRQFFGRFSWKDSLLTIHKGIFRNLSTGVTVQGNVDVGDRKLELEGNLIPLYWLNKPLSEIPLIGELLTGGKGDGLGATRFYVSGDTSNPQLRVNPIQILTPGPIKQLISLLEQKDPKEGIPPSDPSDSKTN